MGNIESRIKKSILHVLEIPAMDLKRIYISIEEEKKNIWIKLKVDLHKLEVDMHSLVHNAHLRSDVVNDIHNTRDFTYKVPLKYEDEIKQLAPLLEDVNSNESEIIKVLDKVDGKKAEINGAKTEVGGPPGMGASAPGPQGGTTGAGPASITRT